MGYAEAKTREVATRRAREVVRNRLHTASSAISDEIKSYLGSIMHNIDDDGYEVVGIDIDDALEVLLDSVNITIRDMELSVDIDSSDLRTFLESVAMWISGSDQYLRLQIGEGIEVDEFINNLMNNINVDNITHIVKSHLGG